MSMPKTPVGADSIVVGFDGGATKSACVAVAIAEADRIIAADATDLKPALLGQGMAGSSNWHSVGIEEAHKNLLLAIGKALREAGADWSDVGAICLGMSGVDRPADHRRVHDWLDEYCPHARILIHNDAVIALASGTLGALFGIVLISGTGMIALGYDQSGTRSRAGGWGALLGDGGSGYAIGAAVLRAVTRAADGRAPQTSLTPGVLKALRLNTPQQLVPWAYADISWARFAQLAPVAYEAEQSGDRIAAEILDDGATELFDAVSAVARSLQLEKAEFPLVLTGSNLRQAGPLARRLLPQIESRLPTARLVFPVLSPEMGAALLARRAQHEDVSRSS